MKTKKELKDAYKMTKFKIGVFQIRNIVNEKIYVDSSVNLDAIWNRNRMELAAGHHRNEMLQKEWKEFGEENFRFEILSEIEQKDNDNIDYNKKPNNLQRCLLMSSSLLQKKGIISRKPDGPGR
jgi:hypothetical protein